MSLINSKKSSNSRPSFRRHSSDSFRSKNSQYTVSFTSEHGSKFGRSVAKFAKQNDPDSVQSVPTVNSRVIQTLVNFPVKIDSKLPDLTQIDATDCIRELGSFMNILDYEFNYTSFWLLDILSKLIKHMQLKNFSAINQNICLMWFRYVLRCISISGDSREEIFGLLEKMFLKAEESIKLGDAIPQPEEIIILEKQSSKLGAGDSASLLSKSLHSILSKQNRRSSQKSSKSVRKSSLVSHTSKRSRSSKSSKSTARPSLSFEEKVEVNLKILNSIIEIIYKVFADRFMFSMIHQAYSYPTIVTPVEIPIDFKDPKLLRPPIEITPPASPSTKKVSTSKSGKKGKDKGKGKGKGEQEADNKDEKSTRKKSKEGKGGKGKKKSKPSLNNEEVSKSKKQSTEKGKESEVSESKKQSKEKGKESKGKTKKKSKSTEDVKIVQENKDDKDLKSMDTPIKKYTSEEFRNVRAQQIEEKLKLFERTMTLEMKLEMKKNKVKDKFILPLNEGVQKDYVENLIKSLLPPENKLPDKKNVPQGKGEGKTRKSSSVKTKRSLKSDKKAKGKKK